MIPTRDRSVYLSLPRNRSLYDHRGEDGDGHTVPVAPLSSWLQGRRCTAYIMVGHLDQPSPSRAKLQCRAPVQILPGPPAHSLMSIDQSIGPDYQTQWNEGAEGGTVCPPYETIRPRPSHIQYLSQILCLTHVLATRGGEYSCSTHCVCKISPPSQSTVLPVESLRRFSSSGVHNNSVQGAAVLIQ